MTITLSPETERALTEAAVELGKTPDELAEQALRTQYLPLNNEEQEQEALRAKVKAARGMFAHVSGGSYAFMARKRYEKLLEERHWQ